MQPYRPEGFPFPQITPEALHKGAGTGEVFHAICTKCDEFHNLHVDLGQIKGIIPREETDTGIADGKTREIAILSRVGKAVCFQVLGFDSRGNAILSRRAAQLDAKQHLLATLQPGDVIPATVQTCADFGVFCDIGCGFTGLMRIDRCCVSRLRSCAQRYRSGQAIYTAVLAVDGQAGQIHLTGRELLGTWAENAMDFRQGQTVTGVIRSILSYGVFIELSPNLSGLAEPQEGLQVGDCVSVYIRSIQPDRHKVKLTVLERLDSVLTPPLKYFITSGHLERWEYYPGSKTVTVF